ncbi:hypothetical protein EDB86DRAFT_3100722 [Lactarius hatsudake]|nr:hypothetical protein EDB86DRAFT_3100722 [Lactarius hatsudake]
MEELARLNLDSASLSVCPHAPRAHSPPAALRAPAPQEFSLGTCTCVPGHDTLREECPALSHQRHCHRILSLFRCDGPCKGSRSRTSRKSGPTRSERVSSLQLEASAPPHQSEHIISELAFTPYAKTSRPTRGTSRLGFWKTSGGYAPTMVRNPQTRHAPCRAVAFLSNEHGHSQPRQGFRPASLSTSEPQKLLVPGTDYTDPLTHIRRAALDLLTLLLKLKECACRGSEGPGAWCSAADGSSRASRSSGMSWGDT